MPAPMITTWKSIVEVGKPLGRAAVFAPVRELLLEQREVRGHLRAADGVLHDPEQHVVAGDAAPAFDPASRYLISVSTASSRAVASCSSVSPPCSMREEQRVGPQVVSEERQVTGEVREGGQQRRNLGLRDRLADLVVGRGDRVRDRPLGPRAHRAALPGGAALVDALGRLLLHEPEEVASDPAHLDLLASLGDPVAAMVSVDVLERLVA